MNIKEKLKTIFQKTLNYILTLAKKHKILASIICLYLIIKTVTFPVYLYKYFRYGHFEKVIECKSNEPIIPSLYEATQTIQYDPETIIEKGTLLFFMSNPYNPSIINTGRKTFKQMGNFLIYKRPDLEDETHMQVFNKNTDLVFYQAAKNERLYKVDTKHKKLIPINTETDKFDKVNVKPISYKELPYSDKYMSRIDDDNLLYRYYHYRDVDNGEHIYMRYSPKDNKQYKIDSSEIRYHVQPIQLSSNKYLFLIDGDIFEPIYHIGLYELVNDKFKKLDIPLPKNYDKYFFSTDNPLVLDEDHIIFVGGRVGSRIFGWWTKKCYLYDIKKAKFIKINDFPKFVEDIRFLKASDGENYIHFNCSASDNLDNLYFKHCIYKYKK